MEEIKQQLRMSLRQITANLSDAYVQRADKRIEQRLLAMECWKQAQTVCLYISVGREVSTAKILRAALAAGKQVAVPRCRKDGIMHMHRITSLDSVKPGRYNIPEPDAGEPVLAPRAIDLIVVPCLAADEHGNRLGHGGGYYDRYLPAVQGTSICLCRDALLQTYLPHAAWDCPVDIVLTEKDDYHHTQI